MSIPTRAALGNGGLTSTIYDAAGQISGLINAKSTGTIVNRFTHIYDNAGNKTRIAEANGDVTSLTYDKSYQLTRERRTGAATYDVTFSYDSVGNRLASTDTGTRTTLAYDVANQIKTEQTGGNRTTYTHDLCGNRTKKDAPAAITLFGWNEDMRMTTAVPPSNPVTLTYNAAGQRIKKVNPTQTRKFLYDFEKVLRESDGADAMTKAYTSTTEQYGDLLSAYGNGQTNYFEQDTLGSTDALMDDSETATDRYRYRAFGLESHYQGSASNDFSWVGKQGYMRDNEIDLYFVRARYYDSVLGRWLSEDPLGFQAGDINFYRYVGNNPVNEIDPSGLIWPFDIVGQFVDPQAAQGVADAVQGEAKQVGNQIGGFIGGPIGGGIAGFLAKCVFDTTFGIFGIGNNRMNAPAAANAPAANAAPAGCGLNLNIDLLDVALAANNIITAPHRILFNLVAGAGEQVGEAAANYVQRVRRCATSIGGTIQDLIAGRVPNLQVNAAQLVRQRTLTQNAHFLYLLLLSNETLEEVKDDYRANSLSRTGPGRLSHRVRGLLRTI